MTRQRPCWQNTGRTRKWTCDQFRELVGDYKGFWVDLVSIRSKYDKFASVGIAVAIPVTWKHAFRRGLRSPALRARATENGVTIMRKSRKAKAVLFASALSASITMS